MKVKKSFNNLSELKAYKKEVIAKRKALEAEFIQSTNGSGPTSKTINNLSLVNSLIGGITGKNNKYLNTALNLSQANFRSKDGILKSLDVAQTVLKAPAVVKSASFIIQSIVKWQLIILVWKLLGILFKKLQKRRSERNLIKNKTQADS